MKKIKALLKTAVGSPRIITEPNGCWVNVRICNNKSEMVKYNAYLKEEGSKEKFRVLADLIHRWNVSNLMEVHDEDI